MKVVQNSVALGLGAIGVAMFSLGFSVTGVACSARPNTDSGERAKVSASAHPSATVTVPEITIAPSSPSTPTGSAPVESKIATLDKKSGLRIKRLVVTERIVEREPVLGETLRAARGPIYAFAEIENTSPDPQKIEITFEHESKKPSIGHAELEIPGNRERFRTWGNTRNIREAGRWQAVVRTEDGTELGRTDFEVESS
jgi:Protein of unknown function (DUF2914)